MKISTLLLPIALLGFAGAAHAGKTAAGPAAGATGVGSVVQPGSSSILNTLTRDEAGNALVAGNSGIVVLAGDQLAQATSVLGNAEGAVVTGNIIRVPTTLNDGGGATIVLNTDTGELIILRKE